MSSSYSIVAPTRITIRPAAVIPLISYKGLIERAAQLQQKVEAAEYEGDVEDVLTQTARRSLCWLTLKRGLKMNRWGAVR